MKKNTNNKWTVAVLLLIIAATSIYLVNLFKIKLSSIPDFPSVPYYPNTKLVMVGREQEDYVRKYKAEWTTKASIEEILSWYSENMPKHGWEIYIPPTSDNKNIRFTVFKKDKNYYNLSLHQDKDGKTVISLDLIVN